MLQINKNNNLKCLKLARNSKKFAGDGSFAVFSSQLHIVHTFEAHLTKGEPWNSLISYEGCYNFIKACSKNDSIRPPLSYEAIFLSKKAKLLSQYLYARALY